ncbi:MAG TPA: RsmG family class I SAM-dependent methyltransferase [Gaiellaceae bacterium]|nr:RsmG family class I SAM-dependent methyltransferase [Gaiellaceae bacterium]
MVDDQTSSLLEFETLLRDRAVDLGMVAQSDSARIRERHILDSLRAAAVTLDSDLHALDIGTGAGLPGIPVAIARPALTVRLVEPRRTRVAFLELALERARIENAMILSATIESVGVAVDLCFARAFAPLEQAWAAARPRLRSGGRLVYFAGAGFERPARPEGCSSIAVVPPPRGSRIERFGPLVIMSR